jgi:pyruvate formate lyase activating enzyme
MNQQRLVKSDVCFARIIALLKLTSREYAGDELIKKENSGPSITGKLPLWLWIRLKKKPLYHFYPGKLILSVGTLGCNLACSFCQNHALAHGNPITRWTSPEELLQLALDQLDSGSIGLAFTYNEPGIWFEYILDTARLLKENNLQVVLVSNGYIEQQPLKQLLNYIDAMNIDVKSFNNDFYQRNCKATLAPVMQTVEYAAARCHVEVTNLIIPGENDEIEEIRTMCRWLKNISTDIPLHLSRYHPAYKFTREATPAQILDKAKEAAREYLNYVFIGNLMGTDNNTYCPYCNETLIQRNFYDTKITGLSNRCCINCGHRIDSIVL